MVEAAGEFALRGGILDVFSPGERRPWRLEFFGDEVETIRTFDAASQLSVEALQGIVIAPLHGLPPQGSESAGWSACAPICGRTTGRKPTSPPTSSIGASSIPPPGRGVWIPSSSTAWKARWLTCRTP